MLRLTLFAILTAAVALAAPAHAHPLVDQLVDRLEIKLSTCSEAPASDPQRQMIEADIAAFKKKVPVPADLAFEVHDCPMDGFVLKGQTVVLSSRLARDLPLIAADRVQIEQVLVNLVRNAIEAANDARPTGGGQVVVETQHTGGAIRIEVTDNGAGIAPESQLRLFEPFFTTKANGIGLGLSISRSIVEAHGGQMWAEMAPGGGARFTFEIPIAPGYGDARGGSSTV